MAETNQERQKKIIDDLLIKVRAVGIIKILLFCADAFIFLNHLQENAQAKPEDYRWESGTLLTECWAVIIEKSRYDSEPPYLLHQLLQQLHVNIAKVVDEPCIKDMKQNPLVVKANDLADDLITELLKQIGEIYLKRFSKDVTGFAETSKSVAGYAELIQKPTTDDEMEWFGALAFTVDEYTILLMVPWMNLDGTELRHPFAIYSKGEANIKTVKSFLDSFIKAFAKK